MKTKKYSLVELYQLASGFVESIDNKAQEQQKMDYERKFLRDMAYNALENFISWIQEEQNKK